MPMGTLVLSFVRRLRTFSRALLFVGALSQLGICQSTNTGTGFPPFGSFANFGIDAVNQANLNVHVTIPIVNKTGIGLPFSYALNFDNMAWTPVNAGVYPNVAWKSERNGGGWNPNPIFGSYKYYVLAGLSGYAQCPQTTVWYTDNSATGHSFSSTVSKTPLLRRPEFSGETYGSTSLIQAFRSCRWTVS